MKKLFKKPKKIPAKLLKVLYDTYLWGYKDSQEGKTPEDQETFNTSIQGGYDKSFKKKD